MPKPGKEKSEAIAVIDIGSNELRLRVAEDKQGKLKSLEHISYPLSLGKDTFSDEKINFQHIEKVNENIKNFLTVMAGYGVKRYRAVTTTAIRESKNRDYILDQIKIKTGVTLDVLDDAEEKSYIYKLMAGLVDPAYLESALMVYTGAGNIGVSVWMNGKIPYVQNVKMGSLRLSGMFEEIQEYTGRFYTAVEEYIKSLTDFLNLPGGIKNVIISGQEASMIAELTEAKRGKSFLTIEGKKLEALFGDIKNKAVERIAEDYNISREKAGVLLPAVLIYRNLLSLTDANNIVSPHAFLSDALLYEMLYPARFYTINREFNKSTLICAYATADKYRSKAAHYKAVEHHALQIFDRMRKIHGMGKRDKLLLQTAAVLHDVGKFINLNRHYMHSYNIVKGTSITGLNILETEIVAQLCLYHSRLTPETEPEPYQKLSVHERVLVSKLAAILRLAEALDSSHKQKIESIEAVVSEGGLLITAGTNENMDLEVWAFGEKAEMFEEVFGIKAAVKQRRSV